MIIMVASSEFVNSLYAFAYGYARLDFKSQSKKVFSMIPMPLFPVLGLLVALVLLWTYLKNRRKKIAVDVDNFLTKLNEGVLISEDDEDEKPGLLTSNRVNLAKKIGIAIDRDLIEHGMTSNHVFFLLNRNDLDIFTEEVLEIIGNKHVWIFTEHDIKPKWKKKFEKIGKVVVFNQKYLQAFGNGDLTLGLIARYLSLISRDGDTNLDHVYHAIPDISTISYDFLIDNHKSFASVLKHQKHLCGYAGDSCLQITNYKDFILDFTHSVKLVNAETEPFFISFREVI